jgi:predicted Zn-dependent protease
MMLPVLILSLSLLFNTEPFAKEGNREMEIILVPVGEIDRNVLNWLKNDLTKVFNRQVVTGRGMPEAVHELGHTYGLGHCGNPRCVMFFSNSLADTDGKGSGFCPSCESKLRSSSILHP